MAAAADEGGQPDTPHPPTLFQGQVSSCYSAYRPAYTKQLYDIILSHLPHPEQRGLAVDVATGNGQAAVQLAQHFSQVLATDASEDQLKHARAAANVTYRQCDAHSIDLPDKSADLVTAASALHWLDQRSFYELRTQFLGEVRRVLKPQHGCLAGWAIPLGLARLAVPAAPAAEPAVQAALDHIYAKLGPCWDVRKRHADNMYAGIGPSLLDFDLVLMRQLNTPTELTVSDFAGYIASWSAYHSYRRQHPDQPDPLQHFQAQLAAALEAHGLSSADADAIIVANIPTVFLLAQGPKPVN